MSCTLRHVVLAALCVPLFAAPAVASGPYCEDPSATVSLDLGPADGFNVFLFHDWYDTLDVAGPAAAGGTVIAEGFSIGYAAEDDQPALVAGRGLLLQSGTIGGDAWYGRWAHHQNVTVLGTLQEGAPIDFDVAEAELMARSAALSSVPANGSTTKSQWGELTLTGSDPAVNVFELPGLDLYGASYFELDIPAGAYALINVSDQIFNVHDFAMVLGDTPPERVLFNLYEARHVSIRQMTFRGSMLAPKGDVWFEGAFDGTMVAYCVKGPGELHHFPFEGGVEVPLCTGGLPEGSCEVEWSVWTSWPVSEWQDAYHGAITFTWNGPAVSAWTLAFELGGDEAIYDHWGGSAVQSGAYVEVQSLDWNAVLGDGESREVGYLASISAGTLTPPVGFAVNGVPCSVQ